VVLRHYKLVVEELQQRMKIACYEALQKDQLGPLPYIHDLRRQRASDQGEAHPRLQGRFAANGHAVRRGHVLRPGRQRRRSAWKHAHLDCRAVCVPNAHAADARLNRARFLLAMWFEVFGTGPTRLLEFLRHSLSSEWCYSHPTFEMWSLAYSEKLPCIS
jgi:hypothetical protein